MNETEEALLPETAPAPVSAETAETSGNAIPADSSAGTGEFRERRFRPVSLLRRGIPLLLAGFAAAVFGWNAGSAVLSAGITEERIVGFLLGEAVGGSSRVLAIHPDGDSGRSARSDELLPPVTPVPPQTPEEEPPDEPDTGAESDAASEPGGNAEWNPESEANLPDSVLRLSNETTYTPDMAEILLRPRVIPPAEGLSAEEDAPTVLILHTHATEAYADSPDARDTDPEKSVVAVGQHIADRLNEAGIPALHDVTLFDEPDFTMAYYNASLAIRKALAEHPSVQYILDVHRDSVRDASGDELALTCETVSGRAARLMLVIGTDEGGADHPDWRDNLALAARLQLALSAEHPLLMRDINLRSASFNEQYAPGSLLLEVGSCGSTLEETRTEKWEVIDYALKLLHISPEETVMVGDREHDVLGAKKCNVPCIGVLYGYGSREELVKAGAAAIAETPEQVADIILSGNL